MRLKKIPLYWQILVAIPLGILYGIYLPEYVGWVSWMGIVFMKALKMIILPLIISSIVSGISQIGSSADLGRIGLKTIGLYLGTSTLAILTGMGLVLLVKPGVNADLGFSEQVDALKIANESFSDTLLNLIPENIFRSMYAGDILPIILFFILFAYFINQSESGARKTLSSFFESIFAVMMKMTTFIIGFAAFGIFGIIAKTVSESTNLTSIAIHLGLYMLVVLAGLVIHSSLSLPILLRVFGIKAKAHFSSMKIPLLTAFSTASSSATLPLTIEAVENRSGVSNKISSFTLPLGATINMDGTALYELVAAIFIAQAYGIELSFVQLIIAVMVTLLASIGAAGIPMAGLVMMSIILSALGLPLEGVGLILVVDRILDMFRTSVNVWSDSCIACIVAKTEGETLKVEK